MYSVRKLFRIVTNTTQNWQGHQKQSLNNCYTQDKPKETWWLNVRWHPKWNPGTEKTLDKN
jgi:hypothetical protein